MNYDSYKTATPESEMNLDYYQVEVTFKTYYLDEEEIKEYLKNDEYYSEKDGDYIHWTVNIRDEYARGSVEETVKDEFYFLTYYGMTQEDIEVSYR